ncbi:hypothetical protein [Streptantibioticus cattleyicolor]|uniref:hypothetical protein n=1 Tax=Streptantibioticus cattleyicolor TaxID=29303 RepID=UPI000213EBE8|nr:hypothetical protein [Streptantibioticus cattleyicolor]CCB71832.1 exported protein of unknown function [Streptantibioticus cattleyicolor NRRL 8057 = DSM 46488]
MSDRRSPSARTGSPSAPKRRRAGVTIAAVVVLGTVVGTGLPGRVDAGLSAPAHAAAPRDAVRRGVTALVPAVLAAVRGGHSS